MPTRAPSRHGDIHPLRLDTFRSKRIHTHHAAPKHGRPKIRLCGARACCAGGSTCVRGRERMKQLDHLCAELALVPLVRAVGRTQCDVPVQRAACNNTTCRMQQDATYTVQHAIIQHATIQQYTMQHSIKAPTTVPTAIPTIFQTELVLSWYAHVSVKLEQYLGVQYAFWQAEYCK